MGGNLSRESQSIDKLGHHQKLRIEQFDDFSCRTPIE